MLPPRLLAPRVQLQEAHETLQVRKPPTTHRGAAHRPSARGDREVGLSGVREATLRTTTTACYGPPSLASSTLQQAAD